MKTRINRLLIVSHVRHYQFEGNIYAYGPYAREIEIWADLFPEIHIAAPCRVETPASDCLAFRAKNISVIAQKETGGDNLKDKIRQAVSLPKLCVDLARAMRDADAIHVRCPGNLGLLGAVLAPLFSRNVVAKYSNQWGSFPGEPWSWKFQRFLLRSRWWRGPVTVYAPKTQAHGEVVPFFTSILTTDQMMRARQSASRPAGSNRLRVLYVGRLTESKNIDTLLLAVSELAKEGCALDCTIIGEGPQRPALEKLSAERGVRDIVRFEGGVPFDSVLSHLEKADILVLVSETEGWPKAIAEGMAFGLICVGTNRGLVPELLSEGRGFTVPPGNPEALVRVLRKIVDNPAGLAEMRARAARWGQQFSLELLSESLRQLLSRRWRVQL